MGPLLERVPGVLALVTAHSARDGEPVYRAVAVSIFPRSTAVPNPAAGTAPSQRDQHIQMVGDKGRLGWQKAASHNQRSSAKTIMFRYKAIVGSSLRARTLSAQKTEAKVACSVLNRITRLGMPVVQRVR